MPFPERVHTSAHSFFYRRDVLPVNAYIPKTLDFIENSLY